MRKVFLFLAFFTCSLPFCYSQAWLWGAQATGCLKSNDLGAPVAADKYGNAIITGTYYTAVTFGTNNMISNSITPYVVKYNSAGTMQWALSSNTYYSGYAYATSIYTDTAANIFVTGFFNDSLGFGSQVLKGSTSTAYLVKLDRNGNVLWAVQNSMPSSSSDESFGVTTNKTGNAFITGTLDGSTAFGKDTLKQDTAAPNVFIVKFDNGGNAIWAEESKGHSRYSYGAGKAVATDESGNSYVAGYFMDTISFGSHQVISNSSYTAFLSRYDVSGNPIWAVQAKLNSIKSTARASSVATDKEGNIYAAGYFIDTISFGSYSLYTAPVGTSSREEVFLVKYSPAGNVVWAEQSYDSGAGYPQLSSDEYNHVYLTYNAYGLHPKLGSSSLVTGTDDARYIIELDTAGHVLCNSFTYGNSVYGKCGVASDTTGQYIYMAGTLYGSSVTFGSSVLTSTGADPFVARWQSCCTRTAPPGDTTVCAGSNITLNGSPGATSYSWSNGATTSSIIVSPTDSTAYNLLINNGGCITDTTIIVKVRPAPAAVIVSSKPALCKGDSATITTTGGGTYLWSTGATTSTITVKPSKDSTFTVKVSNGICSKDTSITIKVDTAPSPTITPQQIICAGSSVQLTATGGSSYLWSNGATTSAITVNPVVTEGYSVVVSNGPCPATDSTLVKVEPNITVGVCCSDSIKAGTSTNIYVTPDISGVKYTWSPSAGLRCDTCPATLASPTVTTEYYVTATDTNGCTSEDSLEIIVNQDCGSVFVPDAFSPNNDGVNDVLYVRGKCIKTIDFQVYDRWGNMVFESQDISIGWDGIYGHQPMNPGVFSYILKVLFNDNSTYSTKGNVTLVR